MKRGPIAIVLFLHASQVSAQVAPKPVEREKLVLLPMTLAGATDGKGEFKFGAGVAFAAWDSLDMAVSVNASTTTQDGLAALFSEQNGKDTHESAPWEVGGSLLFAAVPAVVTDANAGLPNQTRQKMFDRCEAGCDVDATTAYCKSRGPRLARRLKPWLDATHARLPSTSFCKAQQDAVTKADESLKPPAGVDSATYVPSAELKATVLKARRAALEACAAECAEKPATDFCGANAIEQAHADLYFDYKGSDTCAEGRAVYEEFQDSLGRSLYPPLQVVVGGALGRQRFKYRELDATSGALLSHTDEEWHGKAGFALTLIQSRRARRQATLDVRGLIDSSWTAATKTLKWCTPAGNVPRKDPKAGEELAETDPGETCSETTLGAPAWTLTPTLALRLGMLDGVRGNWRIAAGPFIRVPHDKDKWARRTLGSRFPRTLPPSCSPRSTTKASFA